MQKNTVSPTDKPGRSRLWPRVLALCLALAALAGAWLLGQRNYLLFHMLAELLTVAVAWGIFLVVWSARRHIENDALTLLGASYLLIGLLDLLHALGYQGLGLLGPADDGNLGTQLWIAARGLESVALLLFATLLGRRLPLTALITGLVVLTGALLASILSCGVFPVCFVEGEGLTCFKQSAEYAFVAVRLAVIFLLFRQRQQLDATVFRLLVVALIASVAAGLSFTDYAHVFAPSLVVGHIFKTISALALYAALIHQGLRRPQALLYRELRHSKDRWRALVENSPDLVLTLDQDLHIRFLNHSLPGLGIEQARGRVLDDLFADSEGADPGAAMSEALASGQRLRMDLRRRAAGDETLYEALLVPHRLVTGQPGGLLVLRDVSERERGRAALGETQRQLVTLLENLPGMAYRCRNDAQWTMEFVSHGSQRLTGYAPEEIEGNAVVAYGDLIHPEDRDFVWRSVQESLASDTNYEINYRLFDKEGEQRWIWERGRGVFREGKLEALEGFISDVTDRKQEERRRLDTERQALEAQKLESLGLLAGGIAHDFNNILTAVLGHADLARESLPARSPAAEYLEEVTAGGQRAAELVRQMLAYAGRAPFQVRRLDLAQVVQDMARLLRSSVSRRVRLGYVMQGALPSVEADPAQIQQVILNLIVNASEAIESAEGKVELAVRSHQGAPHPRTEAGMVAVAPTRPAPAGYLCLEVRDDGCGMDEKTLARIFEPFFTTKFTGRGLGMAAVLGIVRRHGGALTLDSAPGEGTTVRLFLPALGAAAGTDDAKLGQAVAASEPLPPRRVFLVVDDDESIRALAARIIEQLGHRVLLAEDGVEALALFRERHREVDAVLLDLTMPRMDGEECLVALRGVSEEVPVVLMSGYDRDEVTRRLAGQRHEGFLQKPFVAEELRQILQLLLDSAPENLTGSL